MEKIQENLYKHMPSYLLLAFLLIVIGTAFLVLQSSLLWEVNSAILILARVTAVFGVLLFGYVVFFLPEKSNWN